MKIKPEDYSYILDKVRELLRVKADIFPKWVKEVKESGKYKDFNKRIRWDIYRAAIPSVWTCDNLYKYMDDTHIDTALRSIQKELNFIQDINA